MEGRSFSLLSFGVFACLLAALTFGMVLLGSYLHWGVDSLFLLAVPVVVAIGYLAWYRTLPYEPPAPVPKPVPKPVAPPPVDDEPFDDPVEEADRLSSATEGAKEGGDSEETVGPADELEERRVAPPERPT